MLVIYVQNQKGRNNNFFQLTLFMMIYRSQQMQNYHY